MAVGVPSFLDGTRRWMDNPSRLFLRSGTRTRNCSDLSAGSKPRAPKVVASRNTVTAPQAASQALTTSLNRSGWSDITQCPLSNSTTWLPGRDAKVSAQAWA